LTENKGNGSSLLKDVAGVAVLASHFKVGSIDKVALNEDSF
jgi:hypothetical protein